MGALYRDQYVRDLARPLPLNLTVRDYALILTVHRYEQIDADQITTLHCIEESNKKTVGARLQRLFHHGFSSPNQPDQVWTTAYHDSSGPDSRSDAYFVTIVGDWRKAHVHVVIYVFGCAPRPARTCLRAQILGRKRCPSRPKLTACG